MEKRNIGKSGLSAPFLGLGTWAIGGGRWWGDNDDALSVKAIETAVEQGIVWIDTAPIYGLYHSEKVGIPANSTFFLPVHRVSPMEKMPGSNRPT